MWKKLIIFIWLSVMSICDFKKKTVPVLMLYIGAILAGGFCLYKGIIGEGNLWELMKALFPGALLLVLAKATGKAGSADGIVLMALGALEGYEKCMYICLLGLMLAALTAGILLICRKAGRDTKIPFVPFLAVGWVLTICVEIGGCGR